MQLTTYTDYALRVLIFVGLKGSELSTIPEISKSYDISRNHLMKVVHQLGRYGFLETVQGRGGGIRLAKPAEEIELGDVVRCTEEHFHLVPCFREATEVCTIEEACALRKALKAALAAFLAVLDDCTLADLLKPRRRLATLLAIKGPAAIARKRA